MPDQRLNAEVVTAMSRFYFRGHGPRHAQLTAAFEATGFGQDAPYDTATQTPNKEQRVSLALRAATRRPARARPLIEELLSLMRAHGCFQTDYEHFDRGDIESLRRSLERVGLRLSDEGELSTAAMIDLSTGGRPALDEQLWRLQRADGDPALAIGTAKDLLEAVAKFVLAELDWQVSPQADFGELWHLARERLELLPSQQIRQDAPGGPQARKIVQSAWTIAEQVNDLRALQGTGHGRILPTGVTPEMARMVVREACSVADLVLTTLDRRLGSHGGSD